ncbi:Uncharacterised protein [Jonesia denitrificans]|nr:Uncharacterised protein [Jonesia denitrificans]
MRLATREGGQCPRSKRSAVRVVADAKAHMWPPSSVENVNDHGTKDSGAIMMLTASQR